MSIASRKGSGTTVLRYKTRAALQAACGMLKAARRSYSVYVEDREIILSGKLPPALFCKICGAGSNQGWYQPMSSVFLS